MSEIPKLPADVARCKGIIQYHTPRLSNGGMEIGVRTGCPHREKCLRFLSPPVDPNWQPYVIVDKLDANGNCDMFKPWPKPRNESDAQLDVEGKPLEWSPKDAN